MIEQEKKKGIFWYPDSEVDEFITEQARKLGGNKKTFYMNSIFKKEIKRVKRNNNE